MSNWSEWHSFPAAEINRFLDAPSGTGVYELRLGSTHLPVLAGRSIKVAYRMRSLLPKPYGRGTRKNLGKRQYVLDNINDIEYRTLPCAIKDEAKTIEKQLLVTGKYLFNT
jgi:hypothetical protein